MSTIWTTRSLVAWMTRDFGELGIPTPRLDAELLVSHVLGQDRVRLYMDLDRPLTPAELSAVRALVVQRRQRVPVAYLLGKREFYQRSFDVSDAVLVPRPDTECLVEQALVQLPCERHVEVLDLCTGSGAIAVTLAAERPLVRVTATDLSSKALEIALRNATKHGVSDRVRLLQGDLFSALVEPARFDLIVANPPYICEAELRWLAPELQHEPALALISGPEGLDVLRRLCQEVSSWLKPSGTFLVEVGRGQAAVVRAWLAEHFEPERIRAYVDLGGVERVVAATASPAA